MCRADRRAVSQSIHPSGSSQSLPSPRAPGARTRLAKGPVRLGRRTRRRTRRASPHVTAPLMKWPPPQSSPHWTIAAPTNAHRLTSHPSEPNRQSGGGRGRAGVAAGVRPSRMLRARLPLKAGASTLAAAASVIGPQHRVGRLARAVARPGAVAAAAAVTGATRGYHVEARRQQVRWGVGCVGWGCLGCCCCRWLPLTACSATVICYCCCC